MLWLTVALLVSASVPPPPPPPPVWLMPPAQPDGQALRALLTRPDEWPRTRARVKVLGYADHMLDRQ
jgi:hypothetical protein